MLIKEAIEIVEKELEKTHSTGDDGIWDEALRTLLKCAKKA